MASLRPLLRAKPHLNPLLNPAANNIIRLRALRHQPRRLLLLRPNSTSTTTTTPPTSPSPTTPETSSEPSPSPPTPTPKSYTTANILSLLRHPPTPRPLLIDLREPSELLTTGHIPTALSLPLVSNPDAFALSADDFLARFGWAKPARGSEVVFYCRAGVRSRAAVRLARGWGGEGVGLGEFGGGWRGWVEEGGGGGGIGEK